MSQSLSKHTASALAILGHKPTKKLGQNFLVDRNVVKKFVRLAKLNTGDNIVEIGPGLAAISDEVLKYGVRLFAIELDGKLFKFLATKYDHNENVNIMHGDAVKFPIAALNHSDAKRQGYKVVSNLPYAFSSAWLEALMGHDSLPESISIIIQLDVANKLLAKNGTKLFGPASIFLQSVYVQTAVHKVAKHSFYPLPNVDSVMLSLTRRERWFTFQKKTRKMIRTIFTNRRKQIAKITSELGINAENWMKRNKISSNTRPEQISVEAWQDFENDSTNT